MRNGVELKKIVEERLREIGEIVDKIENEEIARELKETLEELWDSFDKLMSSVAFVEKDGKSRRDDINGLEIWLPFDNSRAVDFESIGLAGEFDFETRKITPIYVYIGKKEDVDKWLNTFGGLDVIEFVRFDEYEKALREIKRLEKRIMELEFELAGKEKPVV